MILYSSGEIILFIGARRETSIWYCALLHIAKFAPSSFVRLISLIICENYSFEINGQSYLFRGISLKLGPQLSQSSLLIYFTLAIVD